MYINIGRLIYLQDGKEERGTIEIDGNWYEVKKLVGRFYWVV